MFKKSLFLVLLFTLFNVPAHAYNTFHPEADADLEKDGVWVRTFFKKEETAALTVFRAYIPYTPDKAWEVLTDTNTWKSRHNDFKDAFTLTKSEAELVAAKNPVNVKDFYSLVGTPVHPSHLNRQKGGNWTSYVFQRFNFPWPLTDRWAVVEIRNDETNAGKGEYKYEYKTRGGNFKWLKGYWALMPHPTKKGWTEFRGEYKSDPGIDVPHFLAKSVVKSSIKNNVKEDSAELAKRYGPPAQ
ncbi:hypothetical protein K1X76_06600 [bacterium]|nr:hypothetical protein [bacterium]